MTAPCILIVGTADTKADELLFMKQCIEDGGGSAAIMDVGVLGQPRFAPEIPNAEVAAAAGTTLEAIIALGDENAAMTKMAEGAVALTLQRYAQGRVHGLLALGGTMGTDLALDVTAALPLGMPKFVVSTVAYSHLIPPERIAPDLMMILWAGGLYGLNPICRSILAQAAGAVLGACRAVQPLPQQQPLVAISSLGSSNLKYMLRLKPALEQRGYEVAVFHSTGMGGQAIEALARQKRLAAVLDLCLQEVGNEVHGSVVSSGPNRLEAAGSLGIPQIVAPGALDMIDLQTWKPLPAAYAERAYHAHNRLIASVVMTPEERRQAAQVVGQKLARAKGPTAFVLPRGGIQAWDREDQPLHDPAGLAALQAALRAAVQPPVEWSEVEAHINDDAFADAVLAIFDRWVQQGKVVTGQPSAPAWANPVVAAVAAVAPVASGQSVT